MSLGGGFTYEKGQIYFDTNRVYQLVSPNADVSYWFTPKVRGAVSYSFIHTRPDFDLSSEQPFELGGKTGTGPATAKPYDGVFAGLIFLHGEPWRAPAAPCGSGSNLAPSAATRRPVRRLGRR